MAQQVTVGLMDKNRDVGYTSVVVKGDALTLAKAETFATNIAAMSDCKVVHVDVKSVSEFDIDPSTCGDMEQERRGSVQFKDLSDDNRKYSIGVPGVQQTYVEGQKKGSPEISEAGIAKAKVILADVTGIAPESLKPVRTSVYESGK